MAKRKNYKTGKNHSEGRAIPHNKIAECLGYEDLNMEEYSKIYNDLAFKFHDVIQTYQNLPSKKHKALYLDGMLGHIFTNFYDDTEFKFTSDEIAVCAVDAMKATEYLVHNRDTGNLPSQKGLN